MSLQDEIYLVAGELRAIANEGARHADNDYDRQRYGRTLSLRARLVAAIEQWPADDVMEEYNQNLANVTAFVAAEAVVLRDDRILLIKREDNGLWAMPGGWTEVGETWAQSVETGAPRRNRLGRNGQGSCWACSTLESGAAVPSITSTLAYGWWRSPTTGPRLPARKRLTSASSRSTTCPPLAPGHVRRYRWRSNLRAETCRRPTSTRRPDTAIERNCRPMVD